MIELKIFRQKDAIILGTAVLSWLIVLFAKSCWHPWRPVASSIGSARSTKSPYNRANIYFSCLKGQRERKREGRKYGREERKGKE